LTRPESIFVGAITGISSTTIIVKAFQEQQVKGRVTELVFGILIIEDLIAIFLLTILTTISRSGAVSPTEVLLTAMRLVMFLTALIGFGILTVPRAIRFVQKLGQPETTLVASIGICFAAALLALSFGYSVALGAFIAGSLVAESGHEGEIERLVRVATGSLPRAVRFLHTDEGLVVFLTLVLDPAQSLAVAHATASSVEQTIRSSVPDVAEVIVHTEP